MTEPAGGGAGAAGAAGTGADAYCATCDRNFPDGTTLCPDDGTRLVRLHTAADPLLGRTLEGRYTLRELVGEGGMGTVYKAWQHAVGREVAVKVIRATASGDRVAITKRFLREAKLTSRLSQPNSVVVLDFGQTEEGLLYLVMELLRGRTLQEVLRAGRLPLARALRIASQICDALEAAHRLGIVHRDLKPANVLLLDEPAGRDFVKVLDFGLARSLAGDDMTATNSDVIVGTPAYISPEAAQGLALDARSDLYSVGVMLYEMIAGDRPFQADDPRSMLLEHIASAPKPLPAGVPPVVGNLIGRLLEKAPARRPASAAQLREALVAVGEPAAPALAPAGPVRASALALAATAMPEPALDRTMDAAQAARPGIALDPTVDAPPAARPAAAPPALGLALDPTVDAPPAARPAAAAAAVSITASVPEPRPPAGRSRGRWPLALAAVALLAAAAWLGRRFLPAQESHGAGPVAHGLTPAADAALALPPDAAAAHTALPTGAALPDAAPADDAATVELELEPASALVSAGGQRLPCDSPCRLTRPRGSRLTVRISAAGYLAQELPLSFTPGQVHHVTLSRARPHGPVSPPQTPPQTPEPHHGLGIDVKNPVTH